jgi:hypothetical protein
MENIHVDPVIRRKIKKSWLQQLSQPAQRASIIQLSIPRSLGLPPDTLQKQLPDRSMMRRLNGKTPSAVNILPAKRIPMWREKGESFLWMHAQELEEVYR